MILQEQLSSKYKCRYKTPGIIFENQKKSTAENVTINIKIDLINFVTYMFVYIITTFRCVYVVFYIISNPDIIANILK